MPRVVPAVNIGFNVIMLYLLEKGYVPDTPEYEQMALAMALKYADTLKYICKLDRDAHHTHIVPNRMMKYFSVVNGPLHVSHHVMDQAQYKIDRIAQYYVNGRVPSREEFTEIYNSDCWAFDETDDKEIAAARKLFPYLPSPREWQLACFRKSATQRSEWTRFAEACYAIMEFDQVRELQLTDDILHNRFPS